MKNINIITIIICSLSLSTLGFSAEKIAQSGNFLTIDEKIDNEDLRFEMEQLRKEFAANRQQIWDSYEARIQVLKDERKEEIGFLKRSFSKRRDALMDQYGDKRKNKLGKKTSAVKTKKPLNPTKGKAVTLPNSGSDTKKKKSGKKPY